MRHDGKGVMENLGGALRIAGALLTPFLRERRTRWGATDEEMRRVFPGDDRVPNPRWQFLHAVTVEAPARDVWPWIAQMGQGRGGLYSYERLENAVGCRIDNADAIVPALQHIAVGDEFRLHPKMPPFKVALVEPGHALLLHGAGAPPGAGKNPGPAPWMNTTWAFIVEDLGDGRSRLFSRDRIDYGPPSLAMNLGYGPWLIEPIGWAMDTKLLNGIKWRAERRRD